MTPNLILNGVQVMLERSTYRCNDPRVDRGICRQIAARGSGLPWDGFDDELDGLQAPAVGCIVEVAHADEPLAEAREEFLRSGLSGLPREAGFHLPDNGGAGARLTAPRGAFRDRKWYFPAMHPTTARGIRALVILTARHGPVV